MAVRHRLAVEVEVTQIRKFTAHFELPNVGHSFMLVERPVSGIRLRLLNGPVW